ncbi:DUF5983 family protein [Robertmurraya sp. GLU-23]
MIQKTIIERMLDISTIHLTESTRQWLMDSPFPLSPYEKSDYGWFIPIPEDYKVNPNEPTFQSIPEDMKQVLDYAVSIDVQWIMFDCESLVEPNLPIYE